MPVNLQFNSKSVWSLALPANDIAWTDVYLERHGVTPRASCILCRSGQSPLLRLDTLSRKFFGLQHPRYESEGGSWSTVSQS